MKQHDFKGALDSYPKFTDDNLSIKMWLNKYTPEIQLALRIADRVQSGEVSREMLSQAGTHFHNPNVYVGINSGFKAMCKQLLKEVQDDR